MTTLATDAFSIITRDGLPVAVVPARDVLATFLRLTPCSMSWAMEHEGYALREARPEVFGRHGDTGHAAEVRGARAYLKLKAGEMPRGATHWDYLIVRTLEAVADSLGRIEGEDYLAAREVFAPMLSGVIFAAGNGASLLSDCAGLLDGAARTLGRRAGLSEAEADEL